ncbi:MAG: hypothetical protein M3291_09620, partial [Actinomycetota bacterium]|nr:hypothetical protein [Actinomycetota bacterium]
EAQERMGRASREQAMAREETARAARDREAAQDRHARADRLDPDADGRRETPVGDREHHDPHGHAADPAGREHDGDPTRDPGRQGVDPGPGSR